MTETVTSSQLKDSGSQAAMVSAEARRRLDDFVRRTRAAREESTHCVQALSARVDELQGLLNAERQAYAELATEHESLTRNHDSLVESYDILHGEFEALLRTVDAACTGYDGEDELMNAAFIANEASQEVGRQPDMVPPSLEGFLAQTLANNTAERQ